MSEFDHNLEQSIAKQAEKKIASLVHGNGYHGTEIHLGESKDYIYVVPAYLKITVTEETYKNEEPGKPENTGRSFGSIDDLNAEIENQKKTILQNESIQ